MRPGVNTNILDAAPAQSLPVESSIFLVGITEKGRLVPELAINSTDWTARLGVRNTNTQTTADSAEFLYKEGARRIYTSRVVGPGAVTASIPVTDGAAGTVFTAKAKGPGAYGNDLNVVIRTNTQDPTIPVGSYLIRVQTDAAVILEESPSLLDKAAGLFWMDTISQWITYTDGASALDPAAATYSLAGGNDDIAGITDTEWAAAIARFPNDLGTGIIIAPGRTSDTGHAQLKAHGEAFNRVWFGDGPDTNTVATLTASSAAVTSRSGGLFTPFIKVPGLTPGSYRTVPPSVIAAGIAMRNDARGISPNKPAAGDLGISNTALDVMRTFTDAEHQTLNSGGVNVIRPRFGVVKTLGWRTTVNSSQDPKWVSLGNARLTAAIRNKAWLVGERFMFREIDGNGLLVAEWGAALTGEVLMPFYLAGSLFGSSPARAFRVNLSGNTDITAQNRQLLADLIVIESEFAEEITINISKQLITEGVG